MIGSTGGGEAYAFDYRTPARVEVCQVPFVGMELKSVAAIAPSFSEFLRTLARESRADR